jgi:hypothetical protein
MTTKPLADDVTALREFEAAHCAGTNGCTVPHAAIAHLLAAASAPVTVHVDPPTTLSQKTREWLDREIAEHRAIADNGGITSREVWNALTELRDIVRQCAAVTAFADTDGEAKDNRDIVRFLSHMMERGRSIELRPIVTKEETVRISISHWGRGDSIRTFTCALGVKFREAIKEFMSAKDAASV